MSLKYVLLIVLLCIDTECIAVWAAENVPPMTEMLKKRLQELYRNPQGAGEEEIKLVLTTKPTLDSLRFFHAVGTDKASEALLDIALRPEEPMAELAAGIFIETIKNQSQARRLLKAKSPKVCHVGLRGLVGPPGSSGTAIDRELFEDIKRMLLMNDVAVRGMAAIVILTDSGGLFGKEKAEVLVKSLEGIAQVPGANKIVAFNVIGPMQTAYVEVQYGYYIQALAGMKGLDITALRQVTPTNAGIARDCVFVARAFRKDATTREEMHRTVRECPSYIVRCKALGAFMVFGNKEDISVLEEVAAKDPLVRKATPIELEMAESEGRPKLEQLYPLRQMAEQAIRRIRRLESKGK